jgi:hypothetical protein
MIDYLNPSRISANPPTCTTKSTKTAPQRENAESAKIIRDADYTDTTQDYTDEEADNG